VQPVTESRRMFKSQLEGTLSIARVIALDLSIKNKKRRNTNGSS
jgi:hypothetical protein